MNRPSAATICSVLGALVIAFSLAFELLARPWVVVGSSMEPSLRAGDRVLVDVWTYRHRAPRPSEIVLIRPAPGSPAMVKRVARVVPSPSGRGDSLWVLGDNPGDSLDSRQLGPIGTERVVGRVALRLWPFRDHQFP